MSETIELNSLPDNIHLLELMVNDSKSVRDIYRPGPYWISKSKATTKEIKKYGLNDFRGSTNSIGTSYTDNAFIDVARGLNGGIKSALRVFFQKVYPFSIIFNNQVNLTRSYYNTTIMLKNQIANNSKRVNTLLTKYKLPNNTLKGGCLDFCEIQEKISNHYLDLLDAHHVLSEHIDFSSAKSFFEIGGGFGVNVHILIENYDNLRKFIYLDIPPNLYVGTQYLKSFYGKHVVSYDQTRKLKKIEFQPNNELEIICIAPHQIEDLNVKIDIFQNAHSFVEMPKAIVKNYVKHIERSLNENSSVALISYDCFDLNTTFHPDELQQLFPLHLKKYEKPTLFNPSRKHYYYIGAQK